MERPTKSAEKKADSARLTNWLLALLCLAAIVLVLAHLRPAEPLPMRVLTSPAAAVRTLAPMPSQIPLPQAVNVNTATVDELTAIPGIGPALAEAIVQQRLAHGRFYYPQDLLSVKGIGESKLSEMLPYIKLDE